MLLIRSTNDESWLLQSNARGAKKEWTRSSWFCSEQEMQLQRPLRWSYKH